MPPVNPGSRSGLVTAVVIFTILFVTATIFAIYYNVETRRLEELLEAQRQDYNQVIAPAALQGPDVQELLALRQDPDSGFANMSVFDIALAQRNRLSRMITGTTTTAPAAERAGRGTLTSAYDRAQQAGFSIPSADDNLAGAVEALSTGLVTAFGNIQDLQRQVETAQEEARLAIERTNQLLAERDEQFAQVRAETEQAITAAMEDRATGRATVQQIEQARQQERQALFEAQQRMQVQLDTRTRDVERLQGELEQARRRLAGRRIDVRDAAVRQPDGRIVRVAGTDVVYINLGFGDQINPGLTFEVYDRTEGIPPLADGAEADMQQPAGKASIQVTRVGPTSSEARIVRRSPATAIVEGDPIANLVYDRHTTYNFIVYGNFDLNQDGQATPQDAEVVRRLVTQWGGRIVDEITVDTDFVVLGRQPAVPYATREELMDPIIARRIAQAQEDLDAYLDVVDTARSLHIPIVNQNQFLHFVGYYDLVRR